MQESADDETRGRINEAAFDVPDESFMALELVLGEGEGKAGVVEYPAECNDLTE